MKPILLGAWFNKDYAALDEYSIKMYSYNND